MKAHIWTGNPFFGICLIIGSMKANHTHLVVWLGGRTWRDVRFVTVRQRFDGKTWFSGKEWSLG